MTRLLLLMIKVYQYFISPLFPPSCRFTPSCSEFSKDALVKYGFVRGTWLSLWRIIRCNPWNLGGYDPVP
jgi:putative membrane protein insertion efficiency factor